MTCETTNEVSKRTVAVLDALETLCEHEGGAHGDRCPGNEARDALTRLRTGAERAAKLDAQASADYVAACPYLGTAHLPLPAGAPEPSPHLVAVLARLRTALDEAAKVPGLEESLTTNRQLTGLLETRVATLERENAKLSGQMRAVSGAVGLEADDTPKDAVERVVARANTAEARVKELEAAIRTKADDYLASYGEDAEGPHPLVDWAERTLRDKSPPPPAPALGYDHRALRADIQAIQSRVTGTIGAQEALDRVCAFAQRSLMAPPAPAPAQGVADTIKAQILAINQEVNAAEAAHEVLDERGVPRDSGDDEMPPRVELSLAERIRRLPSTHTPPALVEAVGPFVPFLRAQAAQSLAGSSPAHLTDNYVEDVSIGHIRALLAAYDAAKGGRCCSTGRSIACACGDHWACDTHGDVCRDPDAGTREANRLDAAKYRAAVERVKDKGVLLKLFCDVTRAGTDTFWTGLSAVLTEVLALDTPPSGPGGGEEKPSEVVLTADTVAAVVASIQADAEETKARLSPIAARTQEQEGELHIAAGGWAAAKEIKERLLAGPVPEVITRADVERVVEDIAEDCNGVTGGTAPAPASFVRGAREVLLRLSNPPAAPESSTNPLHGAEVPTGTLVETFPGSPFVRLIPRQPTPVPEVPALKWCEDEHDWDGRGADLPGDGRLEVKCSRCPAVARRMRVDSRAYAIPERPKPEPEPAAPEVVWTGDGVRVLADGTWETWTPAVNEWLPNAHGGHRANPIARALAEAKREQEDIRRKMRINHMERVVVERDRAAESMRERAARIVANVGLRNLASVIRAVSLESEGEVSATPEAELREYPRLVDAMRLALGHLRNGHTGRVGEAIATLSQALEGTRS
ncbi:hypothetical protein [Myxococcus sp. CA040A]|uniref:hypothetical protein n=1 Tax=Myxococcus sp. CA040A TaxID=2741738 RepID=UPI00157B36F3|nr:hypothetical protein [Myxococcus sp. CA040A]NTX08964.1 hypothetical protein [Myxococcus sp. CA040A]